MVHQIVRVKMSGLLSLRKYPWAVQLEMGHNVHGDLDFCLIQMIRCVDVDSLAKKAHLSAVVKG